MQLGSASAAGGCRRKLRKPEAWLMATKPSTEPRPKTTTKRMTMRTKKKKMKTTNDEDEDEDDYADENAELKKR